MIFVFEIDITKRNGRRWSWDFSFFRDVWDKGKTWRVGWAIFSLSFYPARSLRQFFDYVESGNAEWKEAKNYED